MSQLFGGWHNDDGSRIQLEPSVPLASGRVGVDTSNYVVKGVGYGNDGMLFRAWAAGNLSKNQVDIEYEKMDRIQWNRWQKMNHPESTYNGNKASPGFYYDNLTEFNKLALPPPPLASIQTSGPSGGAFYPYAKPYY